MLLNVAKGTELEGVMTAMFLPENIIILIPLNVKDLCFFLVLTTKLFCLFVITNFS